MKKEISAKLNAYLANIGIEYVKLHNLHWNVVGGQFKAVHEYLEGLYNGMHEALDEVAELLKMQCEQPLAGMKAYLEAATIEELPSEEIGVKEALELALADMEAMKAQAEDIRRAADAEDDYAVVAMMEDNLAEYSKNIWLIKAMLKN